MVVQDPKHTLADYLQTPEGARMQLVGGELIAMTAPSTQHQKLLLLVATKLNEFVIKNNLGEVFTAPIDVFLDPENVFQPDILLVLGLRSSIVQDNGIHGAPDLVIEILSPSTSYLDTKTKLHAYEKAGVIEYFIIDPYDKEVTAYQLQNGKYEENYRMQGRLASKLTDFVLTF